MRWMTLLATFLAAAPCSAQENDAEKLYRAMENKIRSSKSIHFVFETTLRNSKPGGAAAETSTVNGDVRMAEGGKANFALTMEKDGMGGNITRISDGKSTFIKFGDTKEVITENEPNSKDIEVIIAIVPRLPFAFLLVGNIGGLYKDVPFDKQHPIKDFKLGAKEKIGKQETQMVEYISTMPMTPQLVVKVKVWIDTTTGLPVKRETRPVDPAIVTQDPEYALFETFTTFTLDAKMDSKAFELPR